MEKDYSCLDTALHLCNCNAHYKKSDDYEKKYPQKKDRWWQDKEGVIGGQRVHMITYLGSCSKLEKNKKDSMYHVWSKNGFKNAAGLIWLLEALGAKEDIINKAFKAGADIGKKTQNQVKQSNAIKDVVSWEEIQNLLEDKNIIAPMK